MKISSLLIGIILGGVMGFGLTRFFTQPGLLIKIGKLKESSNGTLTTHSKWTWPESLDALEAAPDNHKVVYEDNNVRILAVILNGKESEPIHTHQWKSIMWIAKPIVPCLINTYKKDKNGNLVKSDSLLIKEMPLDVGQLIDSEGPTSITNLSSENGVAYRVEFKREFEK